METGKRRHAWRGLGLALALLSGCSPAYVYQAWRGHSKLMSGQRPIPDVLADPSTPPLVRERLQLVDDIRRFAFERMAIPRTDNYTRYVRVPRDAATYVVTASERAALKPKTWWFPFIGRVPYKGFFERADAQREAERLEHEGLDTLVGGVSAYSTLRWFKDPVLSTMVEGSPGETAELLLHELTHTAVFFKGQADFNEALATFFGEAGAEELLKSRYGTDSSELKELLEGRKKEADRSRLAEELYGELQKLYASEAPLSRKLEDRETVFARFRERLGLKRLNNAVVLSHHRYRYDLSDFRKAHERLGGDWGKLLALLKSLDQRRPREALKAWLEKPR